MAFIKPTPEKPEVVCLSCGSTLLCQDAKGVHCFMCCAGEWEPTMMESWGYTDMQLCEHFGREPGEAHEIYPRVHTEGARWSPNVTSTHVVAFILGKLRKVN